MTEPTDTEIAQLCEMPSSDTRSNPAADTYGIGEFTEDKHWGCRGALVIDARLKPHHAPPLVEDPAVSRRGVGRMLTGEMAKGLRELGHASLSVWVQWDVTVIYPGDATNTWLRACQTRA